MPGEFAKPLLQAEVPRSAHFFWKLFAVLSVLVGWGFAVFLGSVHGQHQQVQSAINLKKVDKLEEAQREMRDVRREAGLDKSIGDDKKEAETIGSSTTMKSLIHRKAKMILVAKNADPLLKSQMEYIAMLGKTGVHHFPGDCKELGIARGKQFRIFSLAIIDPEEKADKPVRDPYRTTYQRLKTCYTMSGKNWYEDQVMTQEEYNEVLAKKEAEKPNLRTTSKERWKRYVKAFKPDMLHGNSYAYKKYHKAQDDARRIQRREEAKIVTGTSQSAEGKKQEKKISSANMKHMGAKGSGFR